MSMNLLHLDTSILGENSVSRALSAAIVARIRQTDPSVHETYRDLAADPLPHLAGPGELAAGSAVLDEFLAADVIVVGVAFYNFGIPSQLKAWIDRITIAGKTFRYTATGPQGLAGDKRVILAIARGGFYGPNTPTHAYEHAESYLRTLFGFLGISNPEVVLAEGIALGPDSRAAALHSALAQVEALAAAA
jgi:FMN-dependent NADH-azoreductase